MRSCSHRMVLIALVASVACASPHAQGPGAGATTAYVLEGIDGRPLPYLQGVGSAVAGHEVSEGLLQLRADGTFFIDVTRFANAGGGPRRMTRAYEGRWFRSGDEIVFEFEDGTRETARIEEEGALTLRIDGALHRWIR